MTHKITILIILLGVILIVGQVFNRSKLPISMVLVVTGMILSFIPSFPHVVLDSTLVLNVFLPILIYQISSFSSWRTIKKNIYPIAMLSIGHVVFITILVAVVMHAVIPELDWPIAFALGAVLSPPDDVAIVSIAEKISMPERIITILEGEGMFNDAAALILFRVSLAAIITHAFSPLYTAAYIAIDLVLEIVYGLIIGNFIGMLRLKITNQNLQIIASLLTPFLAYLPAEMLGGSGIIATVVTGLVIGHRYSVTFTPQFRLFSFSFWPSISFIIQCVLFLMVGLDMRFIIENIASLSIGTLALYSVTVLLILTIGRFFWVYVTGGLIPHLMEKILPRKRLVPSWQDLFVVSWSGMRGAISLAAALAVPALPVIAGGVNPKNLLIFLVFCVIAVTFLLQGLTLPWLLRVLGVAMRGKHEEYKAHLGELAMKQHLASVVLKWLKEYGETVKEDEKLLKEVKLYIREYRMMKEQLKERISHHDELIEHDESAETMAEIYLLSKIIEVEREEILKLWQQDKINNTLRNKLLARLDHYYQHVNG